ncbi:hypothetical protein WL93_08560 [Burkholderia diffusa]|uniref:DUF4148 domain-containing protein n=1 Tax=Burkholderia diffusa TaxID=488732 RepID=UPI0007596719|nr:DUF4148 domain-containing protein [Burkholderia diffusa]KVC44162.1 hypothetical protein WI71_19125 [Burkholderia diffusa]KVH41462.1 hypothetical protein WJ39_04180 [Burkholderia diffusa]KVM96823.1 hypothetical protein WJ62_21210 [Burkholderia diffusa]KWF94694.1 hypothetical protein WL93_08560 [Burkholderia diffusa]
MNTHWLVAAMVAAMSVASVATPASAQALTRAQVRQQLIDAENSGLRFVTDASYPEMSPLFQQQAEQMPRDQAETAVGSDPAATSGAGRPTELPSRPRSAACVGPESFCTLYFGS